MLTDEEIEEMEREMMLEQPLNPDQEGEDNGPTTGD